MKCATQPPPSYLWRAQEYVGFQEFPCGVLNTLQQWTTQGKSLLNLDPRKEFFRKRNNRTIVGSVRLCSVIGWEFNVQPQSCFDHDYSTLCESCLNSVGKRWTYVVKSGWRFIATDQIISYKWFDGDTPGTLYVFDKLLCLMFYFKVLDIFIYSNIRMFSIFWSVMVRWTWAEWHGSATVSIELALTEEGNFCLCAIVLHFIRHSSLAQLAQKFNAFTISGEWS